MTTSLITNSFDDTSIPNFDVIATLVSPGTPFRVSDNSQVAAQKSTTAVNGSWSLALEQQANISPSGSFWQIVQKVPTEYGGASVDAISVGSGPSTLEAAIITPSSSSDLVGYITQAAADARYLQAGSAIGNLYLPSKFGVSYTSTADETVQWQACINAAQATAGIILIERGGSSLISSGPLLVTKPIAVWGTVPPASYGVGLGFAFVRGGSGNLFDIRHSVRFRDFMIDDDGLGSGARTGAALYLYAEFSGGSLVRAATECVFESIRVTSQVDNEAWQYIVHADGTAGYISGSEAPIRRVKFRDFSFFGCRTTHKTVWLQRVEHMWFSSGLINPAPAAEVQGVTVNDAATQHVHFDSIELIGNLVADNGSQCSWSGGDIGAAANTDSVILSGGAAWTIDAANIVGNINDSTTASVVQGNSGNGYLDIHREVLAGRDKANYIVMKGSPSLGNPIVAASGSDSNIGLELQSHGTGAVNANVASGGGTGGFNVGGSTGTTQFNIDSGGIIQKIAGHILKLLGVTGSPEGVVTAPVGSHAFRDDGGANTTEYAKESGSGNTGWVGK